MDTQTGATLTEISILGIKVNPITESELNREIARIITREQKELILNVNVNAINQALKEEMTLDPSVFLLGEEMRAAMDALAGTPLDGRAAWEADAEALGGRLAAAVRAGDLVLVKGSRGLELERLLPHLGVERRS